MLRCYLYIGQQHHRTYPCSAYVQGIGLGLCRIVASRISDIKAVMRGVKQGITGVLAETDSWHGHGKHGKLGNLATRLQCRQLSRSELN